MIKQAKFIISVADGKNIPTHDAPEIAIAGKSNVGKSSFINFMVNQNKLAKTSQEPGRTRLLNYFEINNGEYYLSICRVTVMRKSIAGKNRSGAR